MTNPDLNLLRLVAGRGRLEILQCLRRQDGPPPTINELSRRTSVPLGTVWHAVHELASLGLVLLDYVGTVTLVRPNMANPVWDGLQTLLDLNLPSPHQAAYDHFARRLRGRLPGIPLHPFGSVRTGTQRPRSDVDVEVVYGGSGHSREAVLRACVAASNETFDRFRIMVAPVVSRRRRVAPPD